MPHCWTLAQHPPLSLSGPARPRLRAASLAGSWSLRMREAVAVDTPASCSTSLSRMTLRGRWDMGQSASRNGCWRCRTRMRYVMPFSGSCIHLRRPVYSPVSLSQCADLAYVCTPDKEGSAKLLDPCCRPFVGGALPIFDLRQERSLLGCRAMAEASHRGRREAWPPRVLPEGEKGPSVPWPACRPEGTNQHRHDQSGQRGAAHAPADFSQRSADPPGASASPAERPGGMGVARWAAGRRGNPRGGSAMSTPNTDGFVWPTWMDSRCRAATCGGSSGR